MKKLFALALLGMVSWALIGTPVQAREISKPGMTLIKHKKTHKKHKKHKTT
jgi:Na+/glutamate symporter